MTNMRSAFGCTFYRAKQCGDVPKLTNITCGLVLHHCWTVSEMSRTFRNSISLADSSILQFSSFRPQSTSSSLFSFQAHLTIMVVSHLKKSPNPDTTLSQLPLRLCRELSKSIVLSFSAGKLHFHRNFHFHPNFHLHLLKFSFFRTGKLHFPKQECLTQV